MKKNDILCGLLLVAATGAFFVACGGTEDRSDQDVGTVASAVLGGRLSDASEDASVFIYTELEGGRARCSGTLVAPNLVLTARHCIVTGQNSLVCTSDGEPFNPTENQQNLQSVPASAVTVFYGADKSAQRSVKAQRIVTPNELSLCKSDIAFVVLESALSETYTPLRIEPVQRGERFSFAGWGRTGDDQTDIPSHRMALDEIRVEYVGPGLIPAGTFAIGGNTVCFGDSGGGANFAGAVGGVYSNIGAETNANPCGSPEVRNLFMGLWTQKAVIERAFEAAGRTPWYAGEPAPWEHPVAAAPCDGGPCEAPSVAPSPAGAAGGCATSRGTSHPAGGGASFVALVLSTLLRRRSKTTPTLARTRSGL